MRLTFFLCLMMCVSLPAWAIQRCVAADGSVTYQDRYCEAEGDKIEPRLPQAVPSAADIKRTQSQVRRLQDTNRSAEAMRLGQPYVGMPVALLYELMGYPKRTSAASTREANTERLVFDRQDGVWTVRVRDGAVTSVQQRPRNPKDDVQPQKRRCATAQEVLNLETQAGSIALSKEEKLELMRQVRAMRQCR